jgi:uncharacterized protein (DUF1330 family)
MSDGVHPSEKQIQQMMEDGPTGPMVMVNLLKYRDRAAYAPDKPEAAKNLSGRDAYQRYGAVAIQHVTKRGGAIVWGGPQRFVFIGGAEQEWDDVVCVKYPSRDAFLNMIQDADYLAVNYHRDAGLERTALLCCDAGTAS